MKREEAIEMLKKDKEQRGNCFISDALDMAIKALQEPIVDFEELKRRIIMEVDGGTDDAWLAYGDVCDRISNSIDTFVSDMRGEEE